MKHVMTVGKRIWFQKNCSITDLNLSWNGFGLVGCKALSKALSENSTIAHLDISCNRIDLAALKELVCGLQLNKSVTSIKVIVVY